MANFTEMGNGMPNIFNFIPEGKAFYHYMKHLKHKHKEDRD